jgi:hypothetical protein
VAEDNAVSPNVVGTTVLIQPDVDGMRALNPRPSHGASIEEEFRMIVREMIELLSAFDPTTQVAVEYDGQYQKVRAVQAQVMLTEGASWGDYQGVEALRVNPLYPASQDEQDLNVVSPREVVIAIWGSLPDEGLGVDPPRK